MSTPVCPTCKHAYWRYDGTIRGYCSQVCFQGRKRRQKKSRSREEWDRLTAIRLHRKQAHGTTDLTEWFDCQTCEELEARYTEMITA